MHEQPNKVRRALGAMRDEVWSDLQHRRVAKRLDEALSPPAARSRRRWAAAWPKDWSDRNDRYSRSCS